MANLNVKIFNNCILWYHMNTPLWNSTLYIKHGQRYGQRGRWAYLALAPPICFIMNAEPEPYSFGDSGTGTGTVLGIRFRKQGNEAKNSKKFNKSLIISFYSALCLQILLLQLFPPISHLIRRSRPAVYLSLLTPSILRHGHFVKSLAKAMKSLRGFRKLSRRSTMTRPLREWRYNRLSQAKYKKWRWPIREILTQRQRLRYGRLIGE